MSRRAARVRASALAALAAALLLAGCSGDPLAEPESGIEVTALPESSNERVDALLGELSTVDGELRVGDELTVLVDLPDQGWTVSSSDPTVAKAAGEGAASSGTAGETSIVRITALAPGEATIVFESEDGERDELAINVSE